MLEKNDLEAIRAIIKEEVVESEKRTQTLIDTKITGPENLILKELGRVQISLENRIIFRKRKGWYNHEK